MLKKLKNKIILVNVLSLTLVLLIMFTAVYFVLYSILTEQENTLLYKVAAEENYNIREKSFLDPDAANNPDVPNADDVQLSLFYVKKDTEGEIIDISPNLFSDNEQHIKYLTDKVDKRNTLKGEIDVNDVRLSYLVEYKSFGKIYIFTDRGLRERVLIYYLIIFIISFFLTIAIVWIISMFISEKAIQPVRTSMEEQKKFVADASHELRTPLAVIRSNIELIMESPDSTVKENEKWLGYIHQEALRITTMTENLLTLERYDSKKTEYSNELFSLSELVEEIAAGFLHLINSYGLSFEKHIQKDIYFYASPEKIKQLLTIFIDNAVKYTKEGSVSLSLKQIDNEISISIKDSGSGIKDEDKDKIFERFYRVDKSRSRNLGGSGLGLSIAKTIIDEYKGKVELCSEFGVGSDFIISFKCNVNENINKPAL